jgi:sulfide:quinone oxidoreductase
MKRIIIVGGGFGGVKTAVLLSKKLKKSEYKITLISAKDYLYLYPFSIWIPTKSRNLDDISLPMERIARKHKFNFLKETVKNIISRENKIITDKSEYIYDYLFIATGTGAIHLPGSESTYSLCGKPQEASQIQQKLERLILKKSGSIFCGFGINPDDNNTLRSGPALEIIFNLDTYLRKKGVRDNFTLTFFAPSEQAVTSFVGEKAYLLIKESFEYREIKFIFDKQIESFHEDSVILTDGTTYSSDLTIYLPGLKGKQFLLQSDLPVHQSGFLPIEPNCRVVGLNNVFAVGDTTHYEGGQEWRIKQGRSAEIMAGVGVNTLIAKENKKSSAYDFTKNLKTEFFLDMGDEGIIILRESNKETVRKGKLGHFAKLLLEKFIKYDFTGEIL